MFWNASLVGARSAKNQRSTRPFQPRRRRLELQSLDDRIVPATTMDLAGNIVCRGTSGSDYITVTNNDGNVSFVVNDAVDAIRQEIRFPGGRRGWVEVFEVPAASIRSIRIVGLDGDDTIDAGLAPVRVVVEGGAGSDLIVGSDFSDSIWTGDGVNTVAAGAGNDVVIGGNEQDSIEGGDGNDLLIGRGGDDQLDGGDGNDTLEGRHGSDSLFGRNGNDRLRGGAGDDFLSGGTDDHWWEPVADDDNLDGGEGNDRLRGGRGNDFLRGGHGSDMLEGGIHHDTLLGDSGNDQLLGGLSGETEAPDSDHLRGGPGNDRLVGSGDDDFLWGEDGNDTLQGFHGDDRLKGGAGNDLLEGNSGSDFLWGEDGNDTLKGFQGDDELDGGAGNDLLEGDIGSDFLWGDIGNDTLIGHSGNDSLDGGIGNDRLEGGDEENSYESDDDVLWGNWGDDELFGGQGNDWLFGDWDHDQLNGGSGNDTLNGGRHNDGLFGGAGNNLLIGGPGYDRFLTWDGGSDTVSDRHFDQQDPKRSEDAVVYFSDFPGNEDWHPNSWTPAKIAIVDIALNRLVRFVGNTRPLRQANGNDLVAFWAWGDPKTSTGLAGMAANGGIYLRNPLETFDFPYLDVVYHEIGHYWDEPSDDDSLRTTIQNFRNVSGWTFATSNPDTNRYSRAFDGSNWWYLTNSGFADNYGKTNPWEDFATSFARFCIERLHFGPYPPVVGNAADYRQKDQLIRQIFDLMR